jgi:hypothetical protein
MPPAIHALSAGLGITGIDSRQDGSRLQPRNGPAPVVPFGGCSEPGASTLDSRRPRPDVSDAVGSRARRDATPVRRARRGKSARRSCAGQMRAPLVTILSLVLPETQVTRYSGHMGDTLPPQRRGHALEGVSRQCRRARGRITPNGAAVAIQPAFSAARRKARLAGGQRASGGSAPARRQAGRGPSRPAFLSIYL